MQVSFNIIVDPHISYAVIVSYKQLRLLSFDNYIKKTESTHF